MKSLHDRWQRKLIVFVLIIALGVLGWAALSLKWMSVGNFSRPVLVATSSTSMNVSFQKESVTQVVEFMSSFAEANSWEVRIHQTRPDKRFVMIEMNRDGMRLVALDSLKPESFDIFFYLPESFKSDTKGVEKLVTEIKDGLRKLPGATVTETKESILRDKKR